MFGEERQCTLDERGDRCGALVGAELDLGQARVVIDDRVRVVVANARGGLHPISIALGTVAGRAMAGPTKARVGADVYVQQIAGARPFVAIRRAALGRCATREARALEHLSDRRVRLSGGASH
jgi:hypothetical protein